jgi:hypothetical protein
MNHSNRLKHNVTAMGGKMFPIRLLSRQKPPLKPSSPHLFHHPAYPVLLAQAEQELAETVYSGDKGQNTSQSHTPQLRQGKGGHKDQGHDRHLGEDQPSGCRGPGEVDEVVGD